MDSAVGAQAADRQVRLPRATAVKNKQPAPTQITAEQILRESKALQADEFKPPKVTITDPEELAGRLLSHAKQKIMSSLKMCSITAKFSYFNLL